MSVAVPDIERPRLLCFLTGILQWGGFCFLSLHCCGASFQSWCPLSASTLLRHCRSRNCLGSRRPVDRSRGLQSGRIPFPLDSRWAPLNLNFTKNDNYFTIVLSRGVGRDVGGGHHDEGVDEDKEQLDGREEDHLGERWWRDLVKQTAPARALKSQDKQALRSVCSVCTLL